MSAVAEWFGVYNVVFRHLYERYGEKELKKCLRYLADQGNDDISAGFKKGGIRQTAEWFCENFEADGGVVRWEDQPAGVNLVVESCAAFSYFHAGQAPCHRAAPYFCDCCRTLNERIAENGGKKLRIAVSEPGRCLWSFEEGER